MASASGKISRIFVKDCAEDQYGNNKRKSIQLEGSDTWYGLGTGKGDGLRVKKGKDWVDAKVGDTIEFLYEEKEVGDKIYCNAKVSDIKLKASAAPNSAASAPSGQAKQGTGTAQGGARTGGSTGGKSAGYEAGIKVGHAINNAVQLVCAEEGTPTLAAIERKAIAIMKLSRKMEQGFESIFDGTYTPMQEKAAPAPAPEPEAKTEKTKRTMRLCL